MSRNNQDEDLFGNDSDIEENLNELKGQQTDNPLYLESDVDEKETFDDSDYFGENNIIYKEASAFPKIKCPDDKALDNLE